VFLGYTIDWRAFVVIQLFGLFDQLYIVYANDYADYLDDRRNTMPTMFSGGSRVLVDNVLRPVELKFAAFLMVFLCIGCGILFTVVYRYYYMIPLMSAGLLLLWMYSYKPLRLSYRGGGELLQVAGTGLLLPMLGYYAQAGSLNSFPWVILLVVVPTSLACAIATAVPDGPADATYEKRTIPVLIGLPRSKAAIIALNAASIFLFYCIGQSLKDGVLDVAVHVLPVAGLLGTLIFVKGQPGAPGITFFGLSAILTTIGLVGGMAFGFLGY
jgi:1,4-dihydroxy-2-naphthoate octaprenyltransferase